jgi:hypothetical protein
MNLSDKRITELERRVGELSEEVKHPLLMLDTDINERLTIQHNTIQDLFKAIKMYEGRVAKLEKSLPQMKAFFTAYDGCGDKGYTEKDGTPIERPVVGVERSKQSYSGLCPLCHQPCPYCTCTHPPMDKPSLEDPEFMTQDELHAHYNKTEAECKPSQDEPKCFVDLLREQMDESIKQFSDGEYVFYVKRGKIGEVTPSEPFNNIDYAKGWWDGIELKGAK